jgi:hypothetical protein
MLLLGPPQPDILQAMQSSVGYMPRSSGLLKGGGMRHFGRYRRPAHLPFTHLSDFGGLRELPDYDPDLDYTPYDLMMLAEKILLEDQKPPTEEPMYLNIPMLMNRQKREVYVTNGIPDPAYKEGLYWRTHPNGRKVSENRRETNSGFYRR